MGHMRISEAVDRTAVPARLLRYYEEQGLLRPQRDPSGYRDYSEDDIAAAKRIRQLLDAGLSTAKIGVLLPCLTERAGKLAPTCPELIADLQRERDRIVSAIEALTNSRTMIEAVIQAGEIASHNPTPEADSTLASKTS